MVLALYYLVVFYINLDSNDEYNYDVNDLKFCILSFENTGYKTRA